MIQITSRQGKSKVGPFEASTKYTSFHAALAKHLALDEATFKVVSGYPPKAIEFDQENTTLGELQLIGSTVRVQMVDQINTQAVVRPKRKKKKPTQKTEATFKQKTGDSLAESFMLSTAADNTNPLSCFLRRVSKSFVVKRK